MFCKFMWQCHTTVNATRHVFISEGVYMRNLHLPLDDAVFPQKNELPSLVYDFLEKETIQNWNNFFPISSAVIWTKTIINFGMLHGEHNLVTPKTVSLYYKRIFLLFISLKKNYCIF